MRPSVRKGGAACGAEIEFDPARDIPDAAFSEIESAFHENIDLAICDYALPQRRLTHRTAVIGTIPF